MGEGLVVVEGKDLVKADTEGAGDAEGKFKCRKVLAIFDGKKGLAGDPDLIGKVLLGHLSGIEAQAADAVLDASSGLAHVKRCAGKRRVWRCP
jgi:hypothetical protein